MKIIKNEIRPVGYCTLEFSVDEIQDIVNLLEDICYIQRLPLSEMRGRRAKIYETLNSVITVKQENK